jgi:hypothetical protein
LNLRPESLSFFGSQQMSPQTVEPEVEEAPMAAIFVLEPDAQTFRMTPLALDDGLSALLPHAFSFPATPGREQQTVEACLDLASRVPIRRLSVPRRFAQLDEALDAIELALAT